MTESPRLAAVKVALVHVQEAARALATLEPTGEMLDRAQPAARRLDDARNVLLVERSQLEQRGEVESRHG